MRSGKKLLILGLSFCTFILLSYNFDLDAKDAGSGGTIRGDVVSPYISRYNAVVYINFMKGDFPPSGKNPHISQKGLVFEPHVLPVLKGSTVDFTNDDTVSHNVFSPPGSATTFNLGVYGPGIKKAVTFNNPGEVLLLCSLHPEMSAYVIVLQNPYFTMTDDKGAFEIKDVPPGTYQLKIWNEKLKETSMQVNVEAGKTAVVKFEGLTAK